MTRATRLGARLERFRGSAARAPRHAVQLGAGFAVVMGAAVMARGMSQQLPIVLLGGIGFYLFSRAILAAAVSLTFVDVHELGMVARTLVGLRQAVYWSDIVLVQGSEDGRAPALTIETHGRRRRLYVPLLPADTERFLAVLIAKAGPDNPLTVAVRRTLNRGKRAPR